MAALRNYRFCGHQGITADAAFPWQHVEPVLAWFSNDAKAARASYVEFVADGVAQGRRPELIGGGLVRSSGGWQNILGARKKGEFLKSDERILGNSEFVEEVLAAAKEHLDQHLHEETDLNLLSERAAEALGIDVASIWKPGKNRSVVQARRLLCYWAIHEEGMNETALAKKLGLTQSAVSKAAKKGEDLAKAKELLLT